MTFNLLSATSDKFRSASAIEASLYALLGFAIVFLGIALLIFVVWLIGKLMVKYGFASAPKKATVKQSPAPAINEVTENLAVADATNSVQSMDSVDSETVAVIMSALMAYYQTTNPKCEFTVKRIKRI